MTILERRTVFLDTALFLFAFCFVVGAGLMIQFWIVPALFDGPSTAVGLIPGIDSFGFHMIAVHQAELIRTDGWRMWELRPGGQGPAGVASIFYAYLPNHPAVLLPLHGVIFGIAVVCARGILEAIIQDRAASLIAVVPFFLFPSFVVVWGQIHKDLFTGAGFLLILLSGLAALSGSRRITVVLLGVIVGSLLVVVMRPYALAVIAAATLPFVLVGLKSGIGTFLRVLAVPLLVFSVLLIDSRITERNTPASGAMGASTEFVERTEETCSPTPSHSMLDRVLFQIGILRLDFQRRYPSATSNLDTSVKLRSFTDYLAYAPQAVGIAVLRPFPSEFLQAQSAVGQVGSVLAAGEMMFAYAAFFFAFMLNFKRMRNPYLLATIAGLLIFILIYVYAIPNLGTLYRMRLFAFTLLVSLSVGLIVSALMEKRRRHNANGTEPHPPDVEG